MPKTSTLNVRIDPVLKSQAEKLLAELGLTPSQAITLFFKQVGYHHGLPFEVNLPYEPNAETLSAIDDSVHGRMNKAESLESLFGELAK
jgi:DNA-damage-inducible protein J